MITATTQRGQTQTNKKESLFSQAIHAVNSAITTGALHPNAMPDLDMQSLSAADTQAARTSMAHVLASSGVDTYSMSPAQLKAAQIVVDAVTSGDNGASFHRANYDAQSLQEGVPLSYYHQAHGLTSGVAELDMQAFDGRNLTGFQAQSIVYNMNAVKLDAFGESFWRTVVMSGENAVLQLSVTQPVITRQHSHNTTGKTYGLDRYRLIDAYQNPDLVASNLQKCIPVYSVANASHFIDPLALAPTNETDIDGSSVATNYLKFNQEFDLLGLSATPALVANGKLDRTDSLDPAMPIDKILLRVEGATATAPSYIVFDARGSSRVDPNPAYNGKDGDIIWNFITETFPLTGAMLDATGAVAAGVSWLADPTRTDLIVRVKLVVNGNGNTISGNVAMSAMKPVVHSVARKLANGTVEVLADSDPIVAQAKTEFDAMEAVGIKLNARRTNLNRREIDLFAETVVETRTYQVPLGTPIVAMKSTYAGANSTNAIDVEAAIQLANVRNANQAVSNLHATFDTLKAANPTLGAFMCENNTGLEAIGSRIINAYVSEDNLDLETVTQSLQNKDRLENVKSAILNRLAPLVADMLKQSNIVQALQLRGETGEVKIVLGTDNFTSQFLQLDGDTRMFGPHVTYEVVSTPNKTMNGKIYVAIVTNTSGFDELNFGNFIYYPELFADTQITRNGATYMEAVVVPRTRFLNTCPILARLNIQKLGSAVGGALPFSVNT